MELERDAGLDDLFLFLEKKKIVSILFIDQTDFCLKYAEQEWVKEEAIVIEVDTEMVDHFQIGKVPQYRFYLNGSEVSYLVGTIPRDEIIQMKKQIFGELHRKG